MVITKFSSNYKLIRYFDCKFILHLYFLKIFKNLLMKLNNRNIDNSILFAGLNNSGKTTLIHKLLGSKN